MIKQDWLKALLPYLKKQYSRDDFTLQEITAAVAQVRGLRSNETLVRAWRFLVSMNLVCDTGGGRYIFDKTMLKAFTEEEKKRGLENAKDTP